MSKDFVLKEVCDVKHNSVKEGLEEIKKNQREMRINIDHKFNDLKAEVVTMVKSASKGQPIKVENHWSRKDKALVIGAVLGSPVLVEFIKIVFALARA